MRGEWRGTIIFSTVVRVSLSRSARLLFSGVTFCVSISGSPWRTLRHQVIPEALANINSSFPSTARTYSRLHISQECSPMFHRDSSGLMADENSP